jgi:hypothetical protein
MMGLDEQQRQAFDDAMQKESEKLRDLEEKLRTAQRELLEATLAADYSETTVRGKAEAVAKIQVDMTMLRAKALASVASTLKPEQKQQLLESPLGAAMLGGGGGGPRGFGGMMGPGGRGGGFPGRGFGEGRDPGPRER